jgi:nitrate reductase cytochrome c-type subunit
MTRYLALFLLIGLFGCSAKGHPTLSLAQDPCGLVEYPNRPPTPHEIETVRIFLDHNRCEELKEWLKKRI